VPVLFYDPTHHAAGLAHAGWRGVAARVAPATVRAMVDAFGTRPEDLWAGIGPSIGPDHYAVGPEVVTAVRSALVGGRFADTLPDEPPIAARRARQWYLDLPGAVRMQLRLAGVGAVDLAGICTACDTTAWYSHRAESGKTGRFGVMVMLG
jgi:YfiH family protein